jgi:hypothetical protein
MRHRRLRASLAALAMLILVSAGLPAPIDVHAQTQPDIAVIVHPSVTIDNLSLADLRRILTGDREFWAAGSQRVTIFIRAPIARERDAVVRDVCQMTEAQFRQHWIGRSSAQRRPADRRSCTQRTPRSSRSAARQEQSDSC